MPFRTVAQNATRFLTDNLKGVFMFVAGYPTRKPKVAFGDKNIAQCQTKTKKKVAFALDKAVSTVTGHVTNTCILSNHSIQENSL